MCELRETTETADLCSTGTEHLPSFTAGHLDGERGAATSYLIILTDVRGRNHFGHHKAGFVSAGEPLQPNDMEAKKVCDGLRGSDSNQSQKVSVAGGRPKIFWKSV